MRMLAAIACIFVFAGCCGTIPSLPWCECTPEPSPSPTPEPPKPLGTIVLTFPSSVAKSYGSLDFKDGYIVEYCKGNARLYKRRATDGLALGVVELDSRLTGLWAVCWDGMRGIYGGTNPDMVGIAQNLIRINENGSYQAGARMPSDTSKPSLVIHDICANGHYIPVDVDGDIIAEDNWHTSDDHYSLRKSDNINPDTYREEFWFKFPISHWGLTRVGNKYWAACSTANPVGGQYPVYEFYEGQHRQTTTATGRWLAVPGVFFTSLKTDLSGYYLWGKGITKATGASNIYKISLGL